MLLHLIRKELLDQLLSLRFAAACIVCLLVFLLSSMVLTRDYRAASSTYHLNEVIHRSEILKTERVFELGRNVTIDRPVNVMNVLVRGIMSDLTESVKVQYGRLDFPRAYEQNPIVPLFPSVDFPFIVGVILSLLALAFSYNAVSGEQETGQLKLVMSYSVPRDLLLLGKWIGGYLALIAPFVVAFLVGLLISIMFPEVQPGPDQVLSVVALLGVALLFLAGMYTLGILVSCRTRTASTTITVLVLLWVVLILAIPATAPYITGQIVTLPSRESVEREKDALNSEMREKHREVVKAEQERTGKENVYEDEEFRAKMEASGEELKAAIEKIDEDYQVQVKGQTRWSGLVARLSPRTAFHMASLDLAAAGLEQEARFIEAVRQHGTTWGQYLEDKQKPMMEAWQKARASGKRLSQAEREKLMQFDASDYPRFDFEYMSFRECLSLIYTDLLLLVVWIVLLFLLTYVSFLRYDVN